MTEEAGVDTLDIRAGELLRDRINSLVPEGVLAEEDIALAPASAWDEVLLTVQPSIFTGQFSDQDKEKIRTYFFTPERQRASQQLATHELRGEELVARVRQILVRFQEEDPTTQGLLLYGSRMNLHRITRDVVLPNTKPDISDIDVLPLIASQSGYDVGRRYDRLGEIKEELMPGSLAEFSLGTLKRSKDFYDRLVAQHVTDQEEPIWALSPDAMRFIGTLRFSDGDGNERVISEEEVNRLLQEYTCSEEYVTWKRDMLRSAKQTLVEKSMAPKIGDVLHRIYHHNLAKMI